MWWYIASGAVAGIVAAIGIVRLFSRESPASTWCADCGALIGQDKGPADGWQLEDGRTVCHACCVHDTKRQLFDRDK